MPDFVNLTEDSRRKSRFYDAWDSRHTVGGTGGYIAGGEGRVKQILAPENDQTLQPRGKFHGCIRDVCANSQYPPILHHREHLKAEDDHWMEILKTLIPWYLTCFRFVVDRSEGSKLSEDLFGRLLKHGILNG